MHAILLMMQGAPTGPVDPTTNPIGFFTQLVAFAHTAKWIAVLLGVYGLLEGACLLGKDFPNTPWLAWLGKGRATLAIAGGISVLGAVLESAMGGGNAQAVFVAALGAIAALWHPQATSVAASKAASAIKTAQAGFISIRLGLAMSAFGVVGMGTVIATGCHTKAGSVILATGQCVLDSGVETAIIVDLAQQNYSQLVTDAVTKFGPQLVTCALQAIAASETPPAPPADAGVGSGSATTAQTRRGPYDPVVVARAKEMLAKIGGSSK